MAFKKSHNSKKSNNSNRPNNLQFFATCTNIQQLKKEFRQLAKQCHTDIIGISEEKSLKMASIIIEYELLKKILPNETAPDQENAEQTDEEFNLHISKEMQDILDNISHLPIDIEIIGTWIWVSGDTYKYKSYLTAYNFVWCPTKKMYQWHLERTKKYHTKVFGIDEIRTTYGTTKVNNNFRPVLV